MKFTVVLHKAEEGGWWVEVPALPGCYTQGDTREETLENVREAIACHLDVNVPPPVQEGTEVREVEV
jgi:predicted RNase H-like HicB family nuclease